MTAPAGRSSPIQRTRTVLKTLEPVFLYDLQLNAKTLERVGGRASVRFDHGARPLAFQWQRRLQQLFLKQFNPQS